jgi:hypothetical protein
MLSLGGVAAITKSPLTTSVTGAVCVKAPLVAVTVSGKLPEGVELEVETLSELEPELEMDAGLNDAVAPAGSPLTLSETVPLNPVPAVTVAV